MLKKLIFSFGLLFCAILTFAQDLPEKSSTLVTDYTNTLSSSDKQSLEDKLVKFDDSTSVQIAVVIMESTNGFDINQYAALLGRKWGVGSKEKNNGIVLLVAIKDRKVAIQTGYGAEGAVPDGVTHDIIYNEILPRFKSGDYYDGLNKGTDQLIHYMRGDYKPSAAAADSKRRGKGDKDNSSPIGFVIIIVIVILVIIFRRGGGGGGHIIGRRGGASPFWWFLAGNMLGGSNRGGGDWGGFSGGGGSSGGGGGFGGFGGGSFGGGGSSGSW